ncbi:MAG: glutamate formimidoyltransferase [Saprospiraceae bacterium]|nr:glutamate formimidoyltransferase [Candidatus Opimibacter iunctus]
MTHTPIIECVPNFSEGRRPEVIEAIAQAIRQVEGVKLLDVDPGKATNRTVMTMAGAPERVIEAAFQAISMAASLIDMRTHTGEHPRMGATDVCPLIPVSGITMEETAAYAHQLAKRVGAELSIPVYMYESAATRPERKNLATVRAGEYEGFAKKMEQDDWKPDYGPSVFNEKSGATVIGARDFLIAYNVNLNTRSERRANSVAFDIREKGRVRRKGNPVTGEIIRDEHGEPVREEGMCKGVKAIGWYIAEYGVAQVSMNITDVSQTSLHAAFDACMQSALLRGMRVTGSELVGLVPLQVMLDAGLHYMKKQGLSQGVSDAELIHIAVKSMGLDELGVFNPKKKIIEYLLQDEASGRLTAMSMTGFSEELASDSPAPGGGSAAAYAGALAASLGTMVANLSANKRGWEDRHDYFSEWAVRGQESRKKLLHMVDEDTLAFNSLMDAFRLPKETPDEKKVRQAAIEAATLRATYSPLNMMRLAHDQFPMLEVMTAEGNPNSVSDAGVGAICALAAVEGGWLNVMINLSGLKNKEKAAEIQHIAESILRDSRMHKERIFNMVTEKL